MKESNEVSVIPGTDEIMHIITHEIHDELVSYFVELRTLLENDKAFFKVLSEQILLVGNGCDKHTVYQMIRLHYEHEDQPNDRIMTLSCQIIKLLFGNDAIEDKLTLLAEEDINEVYEITCSEIREMAGEIVGSLNECDV